MKQFCYTFVFACFCFILKGQGMEKIRLNQIGFYPQAPKIAVAVGDVPSGEFHIRDIKGRIVWSGKLGTPRTNPFSGKTTRLADFSDFKKTGTYTVDIPGTGTSHPFEIKKAVHRSVAIGALKGFYYQRVSTALPVQYAGQWSRAAGHPDNHVIVHPSAASAARPAGTIIASPMGWYDAGDYNKYVVNSGITMGTLLSLYEDFPAYCQKLEASLPESGDRIPDLLDEVRWNLRWMLTMQDPSDGGVYHKLTNADFDAMVMPDRATTPRYVVQKNTIATLDFAAVTAQAARVYAAFDQKLSDSCRVAAERAWQWARQNPAVVYNQQAMNDAFDPDVTTGGYEDKNSSDELIWAAIELYITTGEDRYYRAVELSLWEEFPLPTWSRVQTLAYYSLVRHEKILTEIGKADIPMLKHRLASLADNLIKDLDQHPFHTVMGRVASDFTWGSSSQAANQGIALLQAYRLTANQKYLHAALGNLDYLLGRNATGYSFLTGFGDKPPMHPHHRPSEADGITAPVPGLLSGGPNPGQQDHCTTYPNKIPDESFTDDVCSYASNEIAINWNAPLVYLAAALEAIMGDH